MAASLISSQAARIPITLSLAGAPASTQVTLTVTHPDGIVQTLTATTDATGAGTVAVVPLGTGTLTAVVTQSVLVAQVSATIS